MCAKNRKGTMPVNPLTVKTIVTTELVDKIAAKYGVEVRNVLTGFKFIGEQIGFLEAKGEEDRYIFGFEESYGYLSGSYVRDKDAVDASMLICEMAAFYRKQGKSILQQLNALYAEYGVFCHTQQSFLSEGESGMERMSNIMEQLRVAPPKKVGQYDVVGTEDYEKSEIVDKNSGTVTPITLPKSNVIAFRLQNEARVVVRPSGTEPKIKVYYTTTGKTSEDAANLTKSIQNDFTKILGF